MVLVMVMCGGTDITTIGQDLFRTTAECIIHLILSGGIMIPFIMDTDTDTDMHTGTTHIGGLTIHGITIVHMEEISILQYL